MEVVLDVTVLCRHGDAHPIPYTVSAYRACAGQWLKADHFSFTDYQPHSAPTKAQLLAKYPMCLWL